jgi:hypothetical protein
MKKLTFALFVAFALTSLPSTINAYGGGPTFPPGHVVVVCKDETLNLPFGKKIQIPKCQVRKNNDFSERLKNFLDRLIKGGN